MNSANFLSFKDDDLFLISNFSPAIFNCDDSHGAFVYRVIEIHRIYKMKSIIEYLSLITESDSIKILPEVNEVAALISSGKLIFKREKEKRDVRLSELEIVKRQFEGASNGTANKPAGYVDRRHWMVDLDTKIKTSESSLKDAEMALAVSRGLLALIRPAVEYMLNVVKMQLPVGILADLPEATLSSHVYSGNGVYGSGIKAAIAAWAEMDALEKAINNIVDSCHPSNDKHKMNLLWHKFRMQHYRFYYGKNGENARMFFSANEYVDKMTAIDVARESKKKILSINL